MVANGSEPREILLDPMIAGSRGADGCEFDLEVDRECSPRVERLEMMGLAEEPAQISAKSCAIHTHSTAAMHAA